MTFADIDNVQLSGRKKLAKMYSEAKLSQVLEFRLKLLVITQPYLAWFFASDFIVLAKWVIVSNAS